ncbi:MAG: response regulator [Candidatus Brocadiales bacterium]|nr:response regulator [Candidatus Brocadiales bacterium]
MDKQIRILVVDDEPRICHLIEEVLVQDGYVVDVSFSSTDALQMMQIYNYHLLITDLDMPGIDGLELIQKVKKQNPDIRAIMITGNASEDVATWSLRYGIDNYMKKPFNIVELKKVVKQTLCTHKVVLEKM